MSYSWKNAIGVVLTLFSASGCALFPTAVGRDPTILSNGNSALHVSGTMGAAFNPHPQVDQESSPDNDTLLGGLMVEAAARKGLGSGVERAFRFGAGTFGGYGGYELAYGSEITGTANIVGFVGAIGGGHLVASSMYPFVQPYAGTVMGITNGYIRPELAVRVGTQAGIVGREDNEPVWYAYGFLFGSAEPRIRIQIENFSLVGGLTIGYGWGRCQECFSTYEMANAVIISPAVGVSLNPW